MKKNRGITLISLVITIIVLLILASIATYAGINVIRDTHFTRFATALKITQTKVNEIYESYTNNKTIEVNGQKYTGNEILNIGKDISTVQEQANKVFTASESGITDTTGYKYYDKFLVEELNIEGAKDEEFFINIEKRSVVSYDGMSYEGKNYYTLAQIPDGLYNVEYEDKNTGKPTFDASAEKNQKGSYTITISNIQFSGYIDKWQVKYQKEGQDFWSTSDELKFDVNESGRYLIYIENGNVKSDINNVNTDKKLSSITGNETNNSVAQDSLGNQVVVPPGFIVQNPNDNVTDGIIIQDVDKNRPTYGSEFVWIPVGTVNKPDGGIETIKLSRYKFGNSNQSFQEYGEEVIDNQYVEQEMSNLGNTTAKNLTDFKTSVSKNKGYYIGRYEARDAWASGPRWGGSGTSSPVTCTANNYIYTYVTQPKAAQLSRNMYKDEVVHSDLLNSYAWDTSLVFIQKFGKNKGYLQSTGSIAAKLDKGTVNTSYEDVECHIYDLAGNEMEWTTETIINNGNYCCLARGGYYFNSGSFAAVGVRMHESNSTGDINSGYYSFRPILYINS